VTSIFTRFTRTITLVKKISIAFLLADVVGKELLKSSFAVRFP